MQTAEIKAIIDKYLAGEASEEEQAMLESWYLEQSKAQSTLSREEVSQAEHTMAQYLNSYTATRRHRLWPRISIAAAILILAAGIWIFRFYNQNNNTPNQTIAYNNDIAPGKQGATLILSDGRKISLEQAAEGELAREANIAVRKTKDGEIIYDLQETNNNNNNNKTRVTNTLSTAKGQTYHLRLPDGTLVYLNAASSITYASAPNNAGQRTVSLEGEAYFEVSKDKKHPFIVQTQNQQVTVLGTHFNISSYPEDQKTKTTLLEGSVKVEDSNTRTSITIKPGQQAQQSEGGLTAIDVDTDLAVAWKNNKFLFDSQSIQEIMKMVSRWYSIEVIYQGPVPQDRYSGTVSRFDNISQVLSLLEKSGGVAFKIEGKKIYISKK